jgi:hypothetical protein
MAVLFHALFLYQINFKEIPFGIFLSTSVIAFSSSCVLFTIVFLIKRNVLITAITMYFIILAFYSYGILYDLIDKTSFQGLFSSQIIWASAYILFCSVITVKILKIKNIQFLKAALSFLAVFVCIMYLINWSSLIFKGFQRDNQKPVDENSKALKAENKNFTGLKPDIYYIVLDEYASSQTISDYYGYNNKGFEDALVKRGFYISHTSTTAVDSTEFAIASVLNMEKVDVKLGSKAAYKLISKDSVSTFLKEMGYKYIHIGSALEVNRISVPQADYYYNYFNSKRFYTEDDLTSKLIDMSILRPVFYTSNWTRIQQESVYYSLDKLKESSKIEGPKFVFAHILCPHHPFVFDSEGNALKISDKKNWKDKSIYLGQYIYITKLVEKFVSQLLENDGGGAKQAVIIIQSDHGPRNTPNAPKGESYKIFNAMRIPEIKDPASLEGIPSVDMFKRVFDTYFSK